MVVSQEIPKPIGPEVNRLRLNQNCDICIELLCDWGFSWEVRVNSARFIAYLIVSTWNLVIWCDVHFKILNLVHYIFIFLTCVIIHAHHRWCIFASSHVCLYIRKWCKSISLKFHIPPILFTWTKHKISPRNIDIRESFMAWLPRKVHRCLVLIYLRIINWKVISNVFLR